MDEKILLKIEELEKKVDNLTLSVEKVRKYFQWSLVATLIFFILPLLGLILVVPYFLKTLGTLYGSI